MDEQARLLAIAKENGVSVHHFSGVDKIKEALVEAGVPFFDGDMDGDMDEPQAEEAQAILGASNTDPAVLDEQDKIAEMRDKLTEAEAEAEGEDDEQVERLRDAMAAQSEALDKRLARKKAAAVRSSERVICVAIKPFHVQKTDLGQPDHSGTSIKVTIGQKLELAAVTAAMLEARGQVTIA